MSKFRGFDIHGVPYVYINRKIQGMPLLLLRGGFQNLLSKALLVPNTLFGKVVLILISYWNYV